LEVETVAPRAGDPIAIRVVDRSGAGGVAGRVCLDPRRAHGRCTSFSIPGDATDDLVVMRARRPGRWQLVLKQRRARRPAGTVEVQPREPVPRLLATGDSLVATMAFELAEKLPPAAAVRYDIREGSGISKPSSTRWPIYAVKSARDLQPDATVVFIGGNEGYPLPTSGKRPVACCGPRWVRAYARRVRRVMAGFSRNGYGWVYQVTIPMPRDRRYARSNAAVNAALRQAAASLPRTVRLINASRLLTPGRVYRETMLVDGRPTVVRQSDGIHLTREGAAVVIERILAQMRADGLRVGELED
jgi:hypothetical protein